MNKELEKLLNESRYARKAMKADLSESAKTRMDAKKPHKTMLLSSLENMDSISYVGPGKLKPSNDVSLYGTTSLKLETDTALEKVPDNHRSYTRANVVYRADGADWTEYNRVSVWVYPDCGGCNSVWISLSIVNGGDNPYPRDNRFEGVHHVNVPNKKWSLVSWEIPYVLRDCVSAVMIGYNLHGSMPEMSDRIALYFNRLELSEVDADHYEGWELGNRIAFCHSGYRPSDDKKAIIEADEDADFAIIDCKTEEEAFSGRSQKEVLDGINFGVLDFSEFKADGRYYIKVNDIKSKPFYIGDDVLESPIWKLINFYTQERCGYDLPNSHSACHLDSMCVHPDGRKLCAAGGWHDAGDMSQGMGNTAASVVAMLELAEKLKDNELLFERLLDEARWGLAWLLRTRFGDGYRCVWTTIGLWTKNILGDNDDLNSEASNFPGMNLCAAEAEAVGARLFRGIDDVFADYCLKCAVDDYNFAMSNIKMNAYVPGIPQKHFMATGQDNASKKRRGMGFRKMELMLGSRVANSALELYRITDNQEYLDDAIEYAEIVMDCQQTEFTDWDVPMRGFFYTNRSKEEPVSCFHQGYDHSFICPLTKLLSYAPEALQKPEWKNAVELHAEYIKKTAEYIKPYGILPAAIYRTKPGNVPAASSTSYDNDELMDEDYNNQVANGIKLADGWFLRRFPVAFSFRGFFSVLMSKAKSASLSGLALGDDELVKIARNQLEWILGKNPFARSYMYGEGYDFTPMYTEFLDDMVGEVPVGIQTQDDHDKPFMPVMNGATYYEVWVNTASRILWTIADLY